MKRNNLLVLGILALTLICAGCVASTSNPAMGLSSGGPVLTTASVSTGSAPSAAEKSSWRLTSAGCTGVVSVWREGEQVYFSADASNGDRVPPTVLVNGRGKVKSFRGYVLEVNFNNGKPAAEWGGHSFN